MTPLELLQKYGLPSDTPSVSKRLKEDGYMIMAAQIYVEKGGLEKHEIPIIAKVIKFADLALLCELAEKGERYEKAITKRRTELQRIVDGRYYRSWAVTLASNINAELDRIITESEGEPR